MKNVTNWGELTPRRQKVLEVAEENFGNDTFACSELNRHLAESTTTQTLNKIAGNDNYLRRYPGGSTMLLAIIPGGDNKAKFRLTGQEKLAQKMVNKEGLSLDPSKVDWVSNSDRNNFQSKFNARASGVELRATWTRNKYRLREKPRYIVRSSS